MVWQAVILWFGYMLLPLQTLEGKCRHYFLPVSQQQIVFLKDIFMISQMSTVFSER